jgi:hypothetical protein
VSESVTSTLDIPSGLISTSHHAPLVMNQRGIGHFPTSSRRFSRATYAVIVALMCAGCQTLSHDRMQWPDVDYRLVSCDDLDMAARTLRTEITRLTGSGNASAEDVAGVFLYAPFWLFYLPITGPMTIAMAAEKQDRLKEYRHKLAEFERAARESGCPDLSAAPPVQVR